MPVSKIGQQITLAIQLDHDPAPKQPTYTNVTVPFGATVASIMAKLGHPESARTVADLNGIRSTQQVLKNKPPRSTDRNTIKVPSRERPAEVLNVLAGAEPPKILGGYAKFETIDRYARTGITQFTGYDPMTISVPLAFEGFTGDQRPVLDPDQDAFARAVNVRAQAVTNAKIQAGYQIEADISLLERMAGRDSNGTGIGPPPVIRASTSDGAGLVVGLIPLGYQWHSANAGLLWRVSGLDWDDGAIRNEQGNRIRATCTVTLQEHTHSSLVSQSAAQRATSR